MIIASDGESLSLLQKEFPELDSYPLPSYGIRYPFRSAFFNMFLSARSFIRAIRKENAAIQKLVEKVQPDIILSDNRFGVRNKAVRSIFMTHQINIKAGNFLFSGLASWLNKKMIGQFDEFWIPEKLFAERFSSMVKAWRIYATGRFL